MAFTFARIPVHLANLVVYALLFLYDLHAFLPSSKSCIRRHKSPSPRILQLSVAASTGTTGNGADDRRKQSLEQGNHPLISLNLNLDALAQSAAAPRAQELLQRIHALYQEGYYEVSPDIVSYNSVLKAWKEDNNPAKAYELLQEMLLIGDADNGIHVDVISFNTVILAFAKTGNYPQAEDLLRQMQKRDDLPDPDTVTYNAVLYAFAQSPDKGAAIQAENLLREMMNPKFNVTVDTTSFNTVIHAWSQMADTTAVAAARRAQQLLDHMEQLAAAGNSNVHPDVYGYTTVIQAWARCGQPQESQKVLDRMTARKGLVPNRFTYTAVMSSLAKAGQAEKAEIILNDMMDAYTSGNLALKPDTVAFSSVIDGWAKLSNVDKPYAAERAMSLLERMKELEHEGMGPNARTYTSALTALAKSGTWEACDNARELLNEMEAEYNNGNALLQPTTIHYNTVLHAYARSPRADKALKAAGFMQIMHDHPSPRCRPDIISYNSLLMACANAFGNPELKQKSFAIAMEAFIGAMTSDGLGIRPTSTTVAHFCKAARRILNPQQQKPVLRKTLKLCCDRGLLNQVVLQQVQRACTTEEEWRELAGTVSQHIGLKENLKTSQVPNSWICNARR
jgi:pentatricopeptide repeat protein